MSEGDTAGQEIQFSQPDDVFQVRVSLIDIEPPIWRRLLLPQDVKLPRLHRILQAAMGWTDSHLHQFKVGDLCFGEPTQEYDQGPINYANISLNQIAPYKGSTCVYEYDFGDSWDHLLVVEDELRVETVKVRLPHCLAGERAAPPEDCGGSGGYADLLQLLSDPADPENESWSTWVGAGYDPEAFHFDRVNRILASYAPQPRINRLRTRRGRAH